MRPTRRPRWFPLAVLFFAVLGAPARAHGAPEAALGTPLWRPADDATRTRVREWIERASSGWTPNRGQVAHAGGEARVLYSANVDGARVLVTTNGLRYYFLERVPKPGHRRGGEREEGPRQVKWARVDVELEGATIRPEQARPRRVLTERGVEHFYLPQCPEGILDVPSYAEVEFPEVYPGIDWVVRGEPGAPVHHDFVVRPGADPSRIRLAYTGAQSIEVSEDGQSLHVRTALGEVREGALRCTQRGGSREIGARFVLEGNVVTVRLDDYERAEPLVIDPPLVWSTYYGGEDYDGPITIVCDNVNQTVYAVGYTASDSLPTLLGTGYNDGTYDLGVDGVIWKFNQLGVAQWVTYYGGSGYESCYDAQIDGVGNLYVGGETGSSNFPLQFLSGAYNQAVGAGLDGFLLKFNALGVRQWATLYGGADGDEVNGVSIDAAGKVYLCGHTTSADLPLANPGGGAYFDNSFDPDGDAWVARFGTLGALEWATYLGGSDLESAYGVLAAGGQLYVVGYTWSSDFPTANPLGGAYFQPALADQQDAYVSRFTLGGVMTWSTYYGGDGFDFADDAVIKGSGNVVVGGFTRSTDLPIWNPGGGAYFDNTGGGGANFDFFLAEFTPAAVPVWGTYLGGSTDEGADRAQAKRHAVDAAGQVYLTGTTASSDFPVVAPFGSYLDNSWSGSTDAVIVRFGPNRSLDWSTYFGTVDTDFGTSVSVGVSGCLFATGESWELGSMFTQDPGLFAYYRASSRGSDDVYFTKFCAPNSACCQDNTCVPASSQSQCFAMGGTAFYPGQSCSTVTCTILCTICGKKFNDLNRNGVQDAGEPPLAGWTIQLSYPPNGPVYATTVTNAQGEYCFTAIPCGEWKVSEAHQPGWVQTFPATGAHTVTLGTGSTQNGVDFGNAPCVSNTPCLPSPTWLAAWWPMSDTPGAISAADVAHPDPARNVAQLHGGAVLDSATLCLAGPADYATVPDADQLGLDFGEGSFSIAAWVNATPGIPWTRGIVEKRAKLSPLGDTRGWSLALDGLTSVLTLGVGGAPQIVPGPECPPAMWSHLAVVVDRAGGHGRWYLNGDPQPAFDFVPATGDVTSEADLEIGRIAPDFGAGPGFNGCIADLALFGAALSAADANKVWIPGPISFCPEYALIPQVTTICQGQTTRQVCFNLYNGNATAQTYQWSLAGLPAGTGCSVAGPTQFSPASGTVVIPAGSLSAAICVTITRPTGFTAHNATACFALSFANLATGRCQTRTAKLRVDNGCYCVTPPPTAVNVAARVPAGTLIGIGIDLPCDPIAKLAYQVRAEWLDPEHADPVALSLNGLPPGMPVTGELDGLSGITPTLEVVARYPRGYDPAALYEIVVEADTDGDGALERLAGVPVRPTYELVQSTGGIPPAETAPAARLAVSPNPFFGRSSIELALPQAEVIDIAVFDLGGRRVRTLARGRHEPGPLRLDWNGHDDDGRRVAAGIYFVRYAGGGRSLEAKVVKLR